MSQEAVGLELVIEEYLFWAFEKSFMQSSGGGGGNGSMVICGNSMIPGFLLLVLCKPELFFFRLPGNRYKSIYKISLLQRSTKNRAIHHS